MEVFLTEMLDPLPDISNNPEPPRHLQQDQDMAEGDLEGCLRWWLPVVRVSMHMRMWPVHILSFKFATFCVSFLLPRSYSYRISSVLQFNEVVSRAKECETFSNRSIVPWGSRRPERCIREVEKNATVVKIITYN